MRTKDINKIRAACFEVNPEIADLKFGCRVRCTGYAPVCTYLRRVNETKFEAHDGRGSFVMPVEGIIQILGRPIRLADVMLAVNQLMTHFVDTSGFFYHFETKGKMVDDEGFWNLRVDDLEKQSDETVAFIARLLK